MLFADFDWNRVLMSAVMGGIIGGVVGVAMWVAKKVGGGDKQDRTGK